MIIETSRFGEMDVDQKDIMIFPKGLLGFPDCTRFTFIDEERMIPFRVLQSLDNPALAFVILDPLVTRPDYSFKISVEELKLIQCENTEDLLYFCIVTLSSNIHEVTINLQGPLVFNTKNNLGHQFVITDSRYSTGDKLIEN